MNQDSDDIRRPPIEYFAAFLDGELSANDRALVLDWLTCHPEDAALIQAHRDLLRLWQNTAPVEPSEKVWRETLAQIEGRGSTIEDRRSRIDDRKVRAEADAPNLMLSARTSCTFRGRWVRVGLLGAAAAAAVVLALWPPRPSRIEDRGSRIEDRAALAAISPSLKLDPNTPILELADLDELSLLTADDVDLLSMEGTDARLLVVGNPPVQEPLVLVETGDVTLDSADPDEDGAVPQVRMRPGPPSSPMIVMPITAPASKDAGTK